MKAISKVIAAVTALLLLCVGLALLALRQTESRIRGKAARSEMGVKALVMQGGDPAPVVALLREVKPSLDAGDTKKAEDFLDQAMVMLAQERNALPARSGSPLPIFNGEEKGSTLYGDPQQVTIAGYSGNAMEPFISPDGHFLFFNNQNDSKIDTNVYFAERTGETSFRFRGELPGVNSVSLDAVPSMDAKGHFYFTSLRDYDRTMNSIYTGEFDGKRVTNVRPVKGDISPETPFTVNMDASISPDGETLYLSRAVIVPGAAAPRKSELLLARLRDGAFEISADSGRIMQRINTGPLAYAADIAANGLEIYFTRASMTTGRPNAGPTVRIMVATRKSVKDPFDEPQVLRALTGYVEAPSVSMDGRELFFHKKVGDKLLIYRAVRTR